MPKAKKVRSIYNLKHGLSDLASTSGTQSSHINNPEVIEASDTGSFPFIDPLLSSKKERQLMRRANFLQRFQPGRSQYSKSHAKRLKRKADSGFIQSFLDIREALPDNDGDAINATRSVTHPGKIGESNGAPLTGNRRRRTLQTEKFRHPIILSAPEFTSNPFQAIRNHAESTFLKHIPPHESVRDPM